MTPALVNLRKEEKCDDCSFGLMKKPGVLFDARTSFELSRLASYTFGYHRWHSHADGNYFEVYQVNPRGLFEIVLTTPDTDMVKAVNNAAALTQYPSLRELKFNGL